MNEASARIKINKLLEAAGWRFFPQGNKPPNIQLELNIDITESTLDALGTDFEKTSKGFIDFPERRNSLMIAAAVRVLPVPVAISKRNRSFPAFTAACTAWTALR